MNEDFPMKLTIVGDGSIGKTSLVSTYLLKKFPTTYEPTVVDNYQTTIPIKGGGRVLLDIWDTAGQEDLENIRVLNYPNTDVAMMCYSCVSITTFENIKSVWVKELARSAPKTPFILCGTKADLKFRFPDREISEETAREYCIELKGYDSVQCSAKNYAEDNSNVKHAFALAVSCHLNALANISTCSKFYCSLV